MKTEIEGLIITGLDQSLPTRNYQANIIKKIDQTPMNGLWEEKTESIDHLVSTHLMLTPIEYKERHDKRRHCRYWKISEYYALLKSDKWYKHQPEPITEA